MLPEIDQLHRSVPHQFARGERHHDLPSVRDRHQPRGAVHRGAVVVAVAFLGLTGVIDLAGGIVVHITAGVAALVGGRRPQRGVGEYAGNHFGNAGGDPYYFGPNSPMVYDVNGNVGAGANIFNGTFTGAENVGFGNPVRNSCVFCHNMSQMGNDVAPGQVDLGTTNEPFADPAPHLPLFRITCLAKPNPFYGRVILTSDPGYALTTGKCADVGKITLQSNRGLASRAPYFSNGSAKDLRGIIDYYDRRYNIHYTEQEKQDLVNLLSVL